MIAKGTVRVEMKTVLNDIGYTDAMLFHAACLPGVVQCGRILLPPFNSLYVRDTELLKGPQRVDMFKLFSGYDSTAVTPAAGRA